MNTLDEIANKYNTDKGSAFNGPSMHGYADVYETYLNKWRNMPIRLLEIGICMEGTPGGHSIRMWNEYFPNAEIYGFDLVDMRFLENEMPRVKIFNGDQSNRSDFVTMYNQFGKTQFDFILEDGSHVHEHQIISLAHLFKYVKDGGYYILEDMTEEGVDACCIRNDKTFEIVKKFAETGKIESDLISADEKKYLESNTLKIDMHPDKKNNYRVAIFHKK